jgi:hypothetical protein
MALRYPVGGNSNVPYVCFSSHEFKGTEAGGATAKVKTGAAGTSITLYIPDSFSENVGATWGMENIFNVSDPGAAAAKELINKAGEQFKQLASTTKTESGLAVGPTDLLLFQKPNPFSLTFNYNFVPRNQNEGNAVIDIIKEFKKGPLPRTTTGNSKVVIAFPYIWDIKFSNIKGPGDPAKGDFYKNMALVSAQASYSSGASSILTFTDGVPVQCGLTLQFQAIEYSIMQ